MKKAGKKSSAARLEDALDEALAEKLLLARKLDDIGGKLSGAWAELLMIRSFDGDSGPLKSVHSRIYEAYCLATEIE
jgi:hypothetical protein